MKKDIKNLENLSVEELGKLFPIKIVPYNELWKDIFQNEGELILKTLSQNIALKIEHFGSTAIEELSAKPIIDILVEIPPLNEVLKKSIIEKMNAIEYHFIWRTDEKTPYMHFVKGYTIHGFSGNIFHIHMGDKHHPLLDRIYFRDYLRRNKSVAKDYENLKIELAKKYKFNRENYTNSKSEFVRKITQKAKEESKRCF